MVPNSSHECQKIQEWQRPQITTWECVLGTRGVLQHQHKVQDLHLWMPLTLCETTSQLTRAELVLALVLTKLDQMIPSCPFQLTCLGRHGY